MDARRRAAILAAAALALLAARTTEARSDAEFEAMQSELAATKGELAETRQELAATHETVEDLLDRVRALESRRSEAAAPARGPRIPPVNADNPAVSFVVDTTLSADTQQQGFDFALRSGELFLSAPIDPFLRGYATINGSSEEGFSIEEAAVVTTSLPWNLTVRGGRFFADVGRFSHWHDEALPFVDRPPSLDWLIGGESGAEGVELTWLVPTEHFVQITAGIYNAVGNERREALMEEGFDGFRSFDELTWLVHPKTYFDITDTLNLELGGTYATVAQNGARRLYGFDATLRHQPGTSGFYQGLVLGSEWLWNDEKFREVAAVGTDPMTGETLFGNNRYDRNGGYVYLETYLGRAFSLGVRTDFAQNVAGDLEDQQTYSAFATWQPSEFHRLRLQGDVIRGDVEDDQRLTLQWTAFMGSHTHGFATR